MYPSGELGKLALRKELLQARIALRREQSRLAVGRLTRPLATVDEWWDRWQRVQPMMKIVGMPVALLLIRKVARGRWVTIARTLPIVMRAARAFAGRAATDSAP